MRASTQAMGQMLSNFHAIVESSSRQLSNDSSTTKKSASVNGCPSRPIADLTNTGKTQGKMTRKRQMALPWQSLLKPLINDGRLKVQLQAHSTPDDWSTWQTSLRLRGLVQEFQNLVCLSPGPAQVPYCQYLLPPSTMSHCP